VLLRAVSLIDCDLVGVAGGGTLVVLARLPEGCLDTGGLFDSRGSRDSRDSRGSRTDAFLCPLVDVTWKSGDILLPA
jgi:hypothetical protein